MWRDDPWNLMTFVDGMGDNLGLGETPVIGGDVEVASRGRESGQRNYAPSRGRMAIPGDAQDLPKGLDAHRAPAMGALAYVCRGQRCLAAIDNWRTLANEIRER